MSAVCGFFISFAVNSMYTLIPVMEDYIIFFFVLLVIVPVIMDAFFGGEGGYLQCNQHMLFLQL